MLDAQDIDRAGHQQIGTTEQVVYQASAPTSITALTICNRLGGQNINVQINFRISGGADVRRWGPREIPPGETIELCKGTREMLISGDEVVVVSDFTDSADCWISVLL